MIWYSVAVLGWTVAMICLVLHASVARALHQRRDATAVAAVREMCANLRQQNIKVFATIQCVSYLLLATMHFNKWRRSIARLLNPTSDSIQHKIRPALAQSPPSFDYVRSASAYP